MQSTTRLCLHLNSVYQFSCLEQLTFKAIFKRDGRCILLAAGLIIFLANNFRSWIFTFLNSISWKLWRFRLQWFLRLLCRFFVITHITYFFKENKRTPIINKNIVNTIVTFALYKSKDLWSLIRI